MSPPFVLRAANYVIACFGVDFKLSIITPRDCDRRGQNADRIRKHILPNGQQDVVSMGTMGLLYGLAVWSLSSRSTERNIHHRKTSPLV